MNNSIITLNGKEYICEWNFFAIAKLLDVKGSDFIERITNKSTPIDLAHFVFAGLIKHQKSKFYAPNLLEHWDELLANDIIKDFQEVTEAVRIALEQFTKDLGKKNNEEAK